MKPYYQDSAVTIYHGDCREIVPTLGRFDLLLTDPPYGIGEHGGACRTRGKPGYSKHQNLGWDKDRPAEWIIRMLLDVSDKQVIWGGNYFADILPPTMGWLYWRKLMGGDFSDGEVAWTSEKKALREFTKCPKGMDKDHPCEKPEELMQWCIQYAERGSELIETILDPFAGSCTTGRAAKDLGRQAVLIEREERYCEIGAKRMSQEVFAL